MISEPASLVADASAPDVLCYGGTTNVTVSTSGGTAPYSYAQASVFINEIHYDNSGSDV